MRPESPEIAPRGTWHDDIASRERDESRRSVSGPYRDATDTLRARKALLEREVDEIDVSIARREREARELASVHRALRAPPPGMTRVLAGSVARGLVSFLVPFALGAATFALAEGGVPSVVVAAHETQSVMRLGGQRFVVARGIVDQLVATGGEGVRLEPYEDGGAILGLRVASLASSGSLAVLGLREGDVIVAVDDHRIAAPDGARDAFATMRTAWHFDVVIRRDKQERRISYDVVG